MGEQRPSRIATLAGRGVIGAVVYSVGQESLSGEGGAHMSDQVKQPGRDLQASPVISTWRRYLQPLIGGALVFHNPLYNVRGKDKAARYVSDTIEKLAVIMLEDRKNLFIDVNMGCPAIPLGSLVELDVKMT